MHRRPFESRHLVIFPSALSLATYHSYVISIVHFENISHAGHTLSGTPKQECLSCMWYVWLPEAHTYCSGMLVRFASKRTLKKRFVVNSEIFKG